MDYNNDSDAHIMQSFRSHSQRVPVSPRKRLSAADMMNSERMENVKQNLQRWGKQESSTKTWSRVLVENVLLKIPWYDPQRRKRENGTAPDLSQGWAFFEHVTLARYEVNSKSADLVRAAPGEGEKDTELYSYFNTPATSFKDWGVGVALYFSTMRVFGLALLVGGLCSIMNIIYFRSGSYDVQEDRFGGVGFNFLLRGSAICASTEWVWCEEEFCDEKRMKNYGVTYAKDSLDRFFVKRSKCPIENDNDILSAGIWNIITLLAFIFMTLAFSKFQSRQQTVMDENAISASDYSIRVLNPPPDAKNPDEWRDFFSAYDNGEGITLVTIILNNAPLLRALRARRYFRKELQKKLPNIDLDMDRISLREFVLNRDQASQNKSKSVFKRCFDFCVRPVLRLFGKYLDVMTLFEKIEEKTAEIKLLQQQKYDVSSVIVTFETEAGKRNALSALHKGIFDKKDHLFQKKHVLDVVEPSEPSSVKYVDLDTTLSKRIIQFSITLVITIGLVILSGFLVYQTRKERGAFWAGILTTSLNVVIPVVVNLLMIIENHPREDDRQRSLYIKVTLFRWVNTAITTKFVVPFTDTLGNEKDDLLVGITAILVAEIWISPLLSLCDIMGNLSKHYYAPRATTQEEMFLCFKGSYYNLADKYTDMTKIVFVCYYYCALNPPLLFIGAVVLIVRYATDKFLLRIWSDLPNIGTQVAEFSRKYFLSFAIVAGTVVSSYDWALFNFDRVCEGQNDTLEALTGHEVTIFVDGEEDEAVFGRLIDVEGGTSARVCNNVRCCQQVGFTFPPIPSRFENEDFKWMSHGQRTITSICGWLSVVVLIGYLVNAFGSSLWSRFKSWFSGGVDWSKFGRDQNIDFSNLQVAGYIPQIREPSLAYPLIACDVDGIPQSLVGFQVNEIDNYNVIFDVPYPEMKRKRNEEISNSRRDGTDLAQPDSYENAIFDIVKYWEFGENR